VDVGVSVARDTPRPSETGGVSEAVSSVISGITTASDIAIESVLLATRAVEEASTSVELVEVVCGRAGTAADVVGVVDPNDVSVDSSGIVGLLRPFDVDDPVSPPPMIESAIGLPKPLKTVVVATPLVTLCTSR
jgi:hypothetical protein